mgnify:CR=1 FL=1
MQLLLSGSFASLGLGMTFYLVFPSSRIVRVQLVGRGLWELVSGQQPDALEVAARATTPGGPRMLGALIGRQVVGIAARNVQD